ncbi:MAG: hypothetical protein WBW33_16440 [Bryobacteraceae bacterium]
MADQEQTESEQAIGVDVRQIVQQAVEEFLRAQQTKVEPTYKTELLDERKRREALEGRLNQLVEENRKARAAAEEAERHSKIRSELQKLGVAKVELAFRAVKDDIVRAEDGRLVAKGADPKPLEEFLGSFVEDNPELLPARITGGTGAPSGTREALHGGDSGVELDRIKVGMSAEDLDRVRQEIARVASRTLRGL